MKKLRLIVLDWDGTATFSSLLEKVGRKIFQRIGLPSPPRFFLALSELIDFTFFILEIKKVKVKEHIIKLLVEQKEIPVGILTDRSEWSLRFYLRYLRINVGGFAFIQVRKSIFDFLSPCDCNILLSPKIKPDLSAYQGLVGFAEKSGLSRGEIMIIDDTLSARKTARKLGFIALDPDNMG